MSANSTPLTKRVKLNLIYPDVLESKFTNYITVQNQKDFFTLSFFETVIPPILGETEEERKKEFDKLESADAKCLARFILTPDKMIELNRAIEDNLIKHSKTFGKSENN